MIKLMIPELIIISVITIITLINLFNQSNLIKQYTYLIVQFGLLISMGVIATNFTEINNYTIDLSSRILKNGFMLNFEANCYKLTGVILMFMCLVYSHNTLKKLSYYNAYLILGLGTLLGSMLAISSNNLFNLYLGLELCIAPLLILKSFNPEKSEASNASDYLIINSIFSLILLYGISIIYGGIGNLDFSKIINYIETQHIGILFTTGMFLILLGILGKLFIFPFSLVLPNIYKKTDLSTLLLLINFPNLTLVAIYYNLNKLFFTSPYLHSNYQIFLLLILIANLLINNLSNLKESNTKKYLSLNYAGNLSIGLLSLLGTDPALNYSTYLYITSYSILFTSLIGILIHLQEQQLPINQIKDFTDLHKTQPVISAIILILLLSISGVPPTIGAYVKLLIIKKLIINNFTWLGISICLLSLLNLYSNVNIIKLMYFGTANYTFKETSNSNQCSLIGINSKIINLNYAVILLLGITCIGILGAWIFI